jgi:hypothetical protein
MAFLGEPQTTKELAEGSNPQPLLSENCELPLRDWPVVPIFHESGPDFRFMVGC